jgi:hypothetical protein
MRLCSHPLSYKMTAYLRSSGFMPGPPRYTETGASIIKLFSRGVCGDVVGRVLMYEAGSGCGPLASLCMEISAEDMVSSAAVGVGAVWVGE